MSICIDSFSAGKSGESVSMDASLKRLIESYLFHQQCLSGHQLHQQASSDGERADEDNRFTTSLQNSSISLEAHR